jgi:hypothetical protein
VKLHRAYLGSASELRSRLGSHLGALGGFGGAKLQRARWNLERAMGIEPTSEAWEASILPLNYARSDCSTNDSTTPRKRLKLLWVATGHNSGPFE